MRKGEYSVVLILVMVLLSLATLAFERVEAGVFLPPGWTLSAWTRLAIAIAASILAASMGSSQKPFQRAILSVVVGAAVIFACVLTLAVAAKQQSHLKEIASILGGEQTVFLVIATILATVWASLRAKLAKRPVP